MRLTQYGARNWVVVRFAPHSIQCEELSVVVRFAPHSIQCEEIFTAATSQESVIAVREGNVEWLMSRQDTSSVSAVRGPSWGSCSEGGQSSGH